MVPALPTDVRILVIEDEEPQRRLLVRSLSPKGFAVETAASGEEGLQRLDAEAFAAVICDLGMPGMGGLQALKAIKRSHPSLPVIILTGRASVSGAVEAMQSGAFHFLQKPWDIEDLMDALRRAIVAGP